MNFKELAAKCIKEGFDQGEKLIEMGEYDPMYPEAPINNEEVVTQPVSIDSELLKELLTWAGAEDMAADNVANKAVELSDMGTLTPDHLMDLTGAAEYQQPQQGECGGQPQMPSGIVSPVVPSGPMSPVMASYQRRAKAILEGVATSDMMNSKRNKGNHGLNVKKIKEVIASLDEDDVDGLYKALDDIQDPDSTLYGNIKSPYNKSREDEINDIDPDQTLRGKTMAPKYEEEEDEIEVPETPELSNGYEITEPGEETGEGIPQSDILSFGDNEGEVEVPGEPEEFGSTSQDEIADEISDIDAAADTIEGAVDGAMSAVGDAEPGALDNVDPSILDGDGDGETVEQQISDVKSKIDAIAAELGIDVSVEVPGETEEFEDELEDEVEDDLEDEFEDDEDDDEDETEGDIEDEFEDEGETEDEDEFEDDEEDENDTFENLEDSKKYDKKTK